MGCFKAVGNCRLSAFWRSGACSGLRAQGPAGGPGLRATDLEPAHMGRRAASRSPLSAVPAAALLVLVAAALLSSCSSASARSVHAPVPKSTTQHVSRDARLLSSAGSVSSNYSATASGTCMPADLSYRFSDNSSHGFSSLGGSDVLGVTMVSETPCELFGFPGVSFSSSSGAVLDITDAHQSYAQSTQGAQASVRVSHSAPVGFWLSYLGAPSPSVTCDTAAKASIYFASGAPATVPLGSPIKICATEVVVSSVFAAIDPPPPPAP